MTDTYKELTPTILWTNPPPHIAGLTAYGWKECAEAGGPWGGLAERQYPIHSSEVGYRTRPWIRNKYILALGGIERPVKFFNGKWSVMLPCGPAPLGQFMRMRGWTNPNGPSFQCRCGPRPLKEPHFTLTVRGHQFKPKNIAAKVLKREVLLCPQCYAVFEDTMLEKGFAR